MNTQNQPEKPEDAFSVPRPIETAPQDGTAILVFKEWWEAALWDRGAWFGAHHSSTHGNKLSSPTHWLPQPPPPNDQ